MSDSVEDLVKKYEDSVFYGRHPRSIGLFTIPEYPEYESERGMWSAALDAILTTLRYLAPATLLTLFWGQQSFLFRLLKHIDSAFRAIVFSSEEQKQSVLQWLSEAGPVKVESLDTAWRHGWIVCGVLDAALPGACAGHPPTILSLKHAQAIADHYLGVEPVFSRQELESTDLLSRHQEWKLATYLDRIRQALGKLTPPVSKPTSQRTSPETTQFTIDYVAKGSGLTAAQINNNMYFKIYPTAQQALDPGEITILIKGPRDTYGMTVIPPILGKAQMIRQKLLGLKTKQSFTENALPITQGAAYLRNYGKNDMNKTYFIPKTRYDVEIEVEHRSDHAKVGYKVNLEGRYEIFLTSRGQNIVGSPFNVTASNDIIGILERESFCLEDGEEIDIVDVKTDRKVVLRIVDFVTEKMLLKENGSLEKISDDEAKMLMSTTSKKNHKINKKYLRKEKEHTKVTLNKFLKLANKVIVMNRVCKMFNDLIEEKLFQTSLNAFMRPNQQYIPDIVNSTFNDIMANPFIIPEKVDKFIVPENISVSIRSEKSKLYEEANNPVMTIDDEIQILQSESKVSHTNSSCTDTPDRLEERTPHSDLIEQDSIDRSSPLSATNPFLDDIYEESYLPQKDLRTYVTSENETNISQFEGTQDSSIKIIIEQPDSIPSPSKNNPFIDDDNFRQIERPKSPVFKIMSGEIAAHDDSIYLETRNELISEEMLGNEFINPFFVHHHQSSSHEQPPIADFIIGAPVSLPPIITVPSPEPDMNSVIITPQDNINEIRNTPRLNDNKEKEEVNTCDISRKDFPTSSPITLDLPNHTTKINSPSVSSTFHSLESTEIFDHSHASTTSDNQYEQYHLDNSDKNTTLRKDTWDSAYVSIDENNTSPDSNNNESTAICETLNQPKFSPSDNNYGLKQDEITNMGPAEREIWQTCFELNDNKIPEETRPNRSEFKRQTFTPIIEESDRSTSSGTKEISTFETTTKHSETDTVTVAFTELNDMYQENFSNSEHISKAVAHEADLKHIYVEDEYKCNYTGVDSASESLSDVKRHEHEIEGTISEVQANVTESVSVSPTLQKKINDLSIAYCSQDKSENQVCDKRSNIVLEKKKYWDERIRQIEAKSKEVTILQKKRPASKQLKHDSLTKRKGKQIVKNLMSSGVYNQTKQVQSSDETESESNRKPISRLTLVSQEKADEKLVKKWKKYWDDKLETVVRDKEVAYSESMSPMRKKMSKSPEKDIPAISIIKETNTKGNKIIINDDVKPKAKKDIQSESAQKTNMEIKVNKSIPSDFQIKPELSKHLKELFQKESKPNEVIKREPEYTKLKPLSLPSKLVPEQACKTAEKKTKLIEDPKTVTKVTTKVTSSEIKSEAIELNLKSSPLPIKQEIPEEVYKAFETSPKRFFGTSRKHILNKLDTGKPSVEDKSSIDVVDSNYDTGLVSSRISLFHNLTSTEELPWAKKKSQSLHNIRQRKDSEKSNIAYDRKDSWRSSVSSESGYVEFNKNGEPEKPILVSDANVPTDIEDEVTHENTSLQNKRVRLLNSLRNSFDVSHISKPIESCTEINKPTYVKSSLLNFNQQQSPADKNNAALRRTSISKSEMDIFSKVPNEPTDDYLDKYKSYNELPKINVKSFISLYESASKTSVEAKPVKRIYRTSSMDSQKHLQSMSTTSDAARPLEVASHSNVRSSTACGDAKTDLRRHSPKKLYTTKRSDTLSSVDTEDSMEIKVVKNQDKETTYVCLSDIELEIIESSPDKYVESSPEKTTVAEHIEYKNRFISAKEYFQSLEELREIKRPRMLNECELLLQKQSTESLNSERPQKRVKKNIKSRSLPSSEISKIWNQLQESQKEDSSTKLVKISEKFNVDDLFSDVMGGKLSRQGSLRGIPHKKAVLEAFRSMENITNSKLSSYELAVSHLNDFAKENHVRNAQTYLSEYPYLPTTDPSKYHSRLDTKASGLISFKELLDKKPRRNSVPDLRLNPKFTVDL